jgi:hypothetical protein
MASEEIKRVITIESSESLNTLNNLNARIKELKGSMGDLDITSEEYRQISEDVARLENVKRNAIRGVTAAVEGSYNAYSKELSILQNQRKTLNENTQEYRELTKRVGELQDKLKAMDAEVGVHVRNVGNYASAFDGLQGSVNGVVAKLPSLNGGFESFAMSLNESLPKLIESVQGYKDMAKEAGESVSAMSALAKSVVSWNAVVSIAVTLIAVFGEKIVDWVKEMTSAERRMSATEKAVHSFNKSIEENGLGIGEDIAKIKAMQSAWNDLGDDLKAKERYILEHADAFKDLGYEIGNVAQAEELFTKYTPTIIQAMSLRAQALAAQNLAAQSYERMITLQHQLDATPEFTTHKTVEGTLGDWIRGKGGIVERKMANAEYGKIQTQLNAEKTQAEKFVAMMLDYTKQADTLINNLPFKRLGGGGGVGGGVGGGTSTTTTTTSSKYSPAMGQLSWGGNASMSLGTIGSTIDAQAEREKLKATLDARTRLMSANAEERKKIEQDLVDDIAIIEETRLNLQEIELLDMLRNEELTAEERMAIEDEITKNRIAQADLQIKGEADRAKREKDIKDKELAEDKRRKKEREQITMSMASTTSDMLKSIAELYEEDSKQRKALNAAAIVMDTFKASMAGWTSAQSLPAPFNAIVGGANIAASLAMGAAQYANLMKANADGSNADSALASAQSAPSIASSMPASYTRNLQGDNELSEINKAQRVYVVESDITEAQKSARVRVESASF